MTINILPLDQAVFDRLKSTGRISQPLRKVMTQQTHCLSCGAMPENGRPLFAGYTSSDQPIVVDARCSAQLAELATPVYTSGQLDISVSDEQPVWRYMDFAKLIAILEQRGLFFPRADSLEDQFEGAVGLASREADWNEFYLNYFRATMVTAPPGYPTPTLTSDQVEYEATRLLGEMKAAAYRARAALVSCWHANSVESEALWRLYCPPPTPGVAIRSRVEKLWKVTEACPGAIVGRVHYLDFKRAYSNNGRDRLFSKRLSLAHENEVRIVLEQPGPGQPFLVVPCDLNETVEEIVISPFAPSWFSKVVENSVRQWGFSIPCRRSELLESPFY